MIAIGWITMLIVLITIGLITAWTVFILVQTIKTVTIRPEIHLTQTRTIIIYHDSYLKQAPPGTSFGCTTSKHRLMESQNLWQRLTLNGLSSLMEWHNRFLLFHKQLCSPIDHHHILIKYWRLFVIPIILHVQSSKITTTTKNNCQGAGVSDQLGGYSGVIGSSRPGFYISLINFFLSIARRTQESISI